MVYFLFSPFSVCLFFLFTFSNKPSVFHLKNFSSSSTYVKANGYMLTSTALSIKNHHHHQSLAVFVQTVQQSTKNKGSTNSEEILKTMLSNCLCSRKQNTPGAFPFAFRRLGAKYSKTLGHFYTSQTRRYLNIESMISSVSNCSMQFHSSFFIED